MSLSKLGIQHFRNLEQVEILPSRNLNLILGANASGKTSLLEAIYYLGRASSFRTRKLERVIQEGFEEFTLFGVVESKIAKKWPIGLKRSTKQLQIRLNGQNLTRIADLVSSMPVQVIHPNSHRLLEEGPKQRRRYLDWGVFHVEHSFFPAWQRYQRVLKQRNAALRSPRARTSVNVWDKELLEASEQIHRARMSYSEALSACIRNFVDPILGENLPLELDYRPGWPQELELASALDSSLQRDIEQGYTHYGPHKADLLVKTDGVPIIERVSRGQQKVLVAALLLAQVGLYNEKTGSDCILLVDDVAAELDPGNRARLLKVISSMQNQVFVTAIEANALLDDLEMEHKVFHVEHGRVSEMV